VNKCVDNLDTYFCLMFPGCGEVLEGVTGTFTSPGYPSDYANNLNCEWTISVPSGNIRLSFDSFELETSSTCAYDKLEVSLDINQIL